jgi:hypothetical protein
VHRGRCPSFLPSARAACNSRGWADVDWPWEAQTGEARGSRASLSIEDDRRRPCNGSAGPRVAIGWECRRPHAVRGSEFPRRWSPGTGRRRAHVRRSQAWALASALGAASCGSDTTDDRVPAELIGGWSNADRLLACFSSDGRMWLGDSADEIGGPSYCTVSGTAFHCAPIDGAAFDGTLAPSADELTLELQPCPQGAESCRVSYRRDRDLSCP